MIDKREQEYLVLANKYKAAPNGERAKIKREMEDLRKLAKSELEPFDRVYLARHKERPKADEFIDYLIREKVYLAGDRLFGEDYCLIGGIGKFNGRPVTFLGTKKGKNIEENLKTNFGMPNPEGYRKAQRLMNQANKFGRPILTFIDTSGAYPGLGAEERGQGEAIAQSIMNSFGLKVPIISVVTGEGGSGGALALGVGNKVILFENSVYSILSPEGFSSIIWKDASRAREASKIMKLTAKDLLDLKVVDRVVEEDVSFLKEDFAINMTRLGEALEEELKSLEKISKNKLQSDRVEKFRRIGR
ncbi:MAG: acetyl-CoA carboxylase carboxyltransferase subunit alpha [Tissierellia bacterium]|nr:acetyl-CoA carboxylase carboxyltransferase subunit alpha [Tissierellia bacterium]